MSIRSKIVQTLMIVAVAAGMWGPQAHGQLVPPKEKAKAPTPDAWPEKKEKRGNTPPGKDRAGGEPASGAIVDPGGVTTK